MDNDTHNRASGSTDILAGPDTAIAITKLNKGLTMVECVKSRNAEEYQRFNVLLLDQPHSQAIEMRFEGLVADAKAVGGQKDRAMSLIAEFLGGQPDCTAKPSALKAHVVGQGISETTYNRAWSVVRKSGKVVKIPRQGWQLMEEFRPQPTVQEEAA